MTLRGNETSLTNNSLNSSLKLSTLLGLFIVFKSLIIGSLTICLLLICLVVLIYQSNIPNLKALPMDNYQGEIVIEELRLKVPADVKAAWLDAEKKIWEPWLSSQYGFLSLNRSRQQK